ncbi:group II intron reverse transcriptase/maturase [Marinomonas algarum]|uniref:RNA-directed DNA polymerase n=1 Tax=Marinomonas algarum TaxID=2883105 RepID=A0A9X1LFX0_9GAMM|nr:group II intron reverse transcriptase/maturase [Marinomonas algarum]MCB5163181.1 group II intron reverse transcriptase/maturase [Marinomonas algarum]MCB5163182.1 group II intron reverse transcriptase/maturase [Marinomonas algarum]
MNKAKPFNIDKKLIWQAWLAVKANQGSAGIDGVTLSDFERNLPKNLYKIWNRMSSGCYMPPPVKRVEIPKSDGKTRPLGIPTISDRVAQMTVKMQLEPVWDCLFSPSSFGYRRGKSAHDAVTQARNNCWKYNWVIDLDIKGFFDNIDHQLMLKAVDHLNPPDWARLCIERWLRADIILTDGSKLSGDKGTPQGGVISPLLANLFLHYVQDKWLAREYPNLPFERYADDTVIHCRSKREAEELLLKLKQRMLDCGLELHPVKTRIVCCDTKTRRDQNQHYEFDFLGFTFRRRGARGKGGGLFTGFLPAISKKAKKSIVRSFRDWNLQRCTSLNIDQIAKKINPQLRGWINYYGKFYPSEMTILWRILNERLVRWFRNRSKRYRWHKTKAAKALEQFKQRHSYLFAHWKMKEC